MKKLASLLIGLFLITSITKAQSQELRFPELEEIIPGGENYIYTDGIYGISWWGDLCIKPGYTELTTINPSTQKQTVIAEIKEVNNILKESNLPELNNFYQVSMPWSKEKSLLFIHKGSYIKVDLEQRQATLLFKVNNGASNIDFHKEGSAIAYTIENNLFVNNKQITDNPQGVVAGQTVHRSEFGIRKGTFWSPSGKNLAFYKMDETMVTEYPLVNITTRIATAEPVKYPMAGMESHKVYVGIYSTDKEKTIFLETGDPTNRFFTNIQWSQDEQSIYLYEVNRDQNHTKLCEYNAKTGALTQILYEEKHEKYVEPQNPIIFLPWNKKQFIQQSQKDGYNHLYLASLDKKDLKQLTKGEWLVQSVLGFNNKTKEIIITGTYYSPLQTNTFAVSLKNGKIRSLDNKEGVHSPSLSYSGNFILDKYTSPTMPNAINLTNSATAKSKNIFEAKDPYGHLIMPEITVGTIKAADGKTDLYYRLVKSKNIDSSKKHPAVIYVYGGPHAQMIDNSWNYGARGWDIYMANKGYVVFTLDNRGSSNRGLEFENATFRELGIKEGEDQVEGTKFLDSLGYVDMNRIGVHGWSFGGHMSTALLLRYPTLFKVGVAGGPVIDWKLYEIMYGERYMDTPQDNPEGYDKTNLCNFANQLQGKLLIIHDGHDSTCVPQHTYSFIKACIDARTYPDLFIYPGHEHNVRGRDRVHLYEKITRYFDDNL